MNVIKHITLAESELSYDRVATMEVVSNEKCDVCGEEKKRVLAVDTSEEEYGAATICYKCFDKVMSD